MDYEKKYKNALEWARKVKQGKVGFVLDDVLETFPELKESEDERIRKHLIKHFGNKSKEDWNGVPVKSILAWLEKQGESKPVPDWMPKFLDELRSKKNYFDWDEHKDIEGGILAIINWMNPNYFNGKEGEQKPAEKVEPKFKVGDWVVVDDGRTGRIIECTQDFADVDLEFSCLSTRVNNIRSWTIQDAKDGDLIYVATEEKGIQAIFHEYKNKTIFFHCYLCCDFAQGGYMPIGDVELVYPLQKTHYKRFFEKMHEAGCEWDAEKKELKKIEQNPAWSEEDESHIRYLIECLENCKKGVALTMTTSTSQEYINWLRDLLQKLSNIERNGKNWKPSEAQMNALRVAIGDEQGSDCCGALRDLLKDLKSL